MANGHEEGLKNQDQYVEMTSGILVTPSGPYSDDVRIFVMASGRSRHKKTLEDSRYCARSIRYCFDHNSFIRIWISTIQLPTRAERENLQLGRRCKCDGVRIFPDGIRKENNNDLFFLKNGNTKESLSLDKIHVDPFLEVDVEEMMNRWVRKELKTFNEEARLSIQHWKDSWQKRIYKVNQRRVIANPKEYFFVHKIVKLLRVTTEQQHELDSIEQIIMMRENVKPYCFSKVGFKYLNKNDIEGESHGFQLGIESYQIKINLTAPMLIFPGNRAYNPYFIIDESDTGLSYLNSKGEKMVMNLIKIMKFCDATLERVLKKIKLKTFETEF
uniref:Uncharacterized protein n=1 Tax=Tanacetum cinerariifolium TaxID=118510 RepID=A0A699HKV1_TANCI|nr:hypothetical protein [Tanacetum cinerariifolium]